MNNYTTGRPDVKIHIHNEKTVTADFIIDEANTMWKKVKARNLSIDDTAGADYLMDQLRKEHPDFCKSYPIVLRYMCQMQEYTPRAFRTYLKKISTHPYKNEEEYLDAQADYVVILYKATHAKWNKRDTENLRTNTRAILSREHNLFKKYATKCDEEVTKEIEDGQRAKIADLCDFVKLAGVAGMSTGGTCRVITDIETNHIVTFDNIISTAAPVQSLGESLDELTFQTLLN